MANVKRKAHACRCIATKRWHRFVHIVESRIPPIAGASSQFGFICGRKQWKKKHIDPSRWVVSVHVPGRGMSTCAELSGNPNRNHRKLMDIHRGKLAVLLLLLPL